MNSLIRTRIELIPIVVKSTERTTDMLQKNREEEGELEREGEEERERKREENTEAY